MFDDKYFDDLFREEKEKKNCQGFCYCMRNPWNLLRMQSTRKQ